MPIRYHLYLALLLVIITFLVYYDCFNNSFVYDDYPFIVDNEAIRHLNLRSVVSNFINSSTASAHEGLSKDVWRPFVTTAFAIDYKFWKLAPRFYHGENVALHTGNTLLVYIMTFLVLNDAFAAFIAAIVFSIHPVQTEAVTWVSGRSNVLFLLFFLLSFISHVKNMKYGKTAFYYGISLIFFLCALLSKEMAIVLPLILLSYDMHFYPAMGTGKRRIIYYLPFFLIAAFYIIARFSVLGTLTQKGYWWGGGVLPNFCITLEAIAGYIKTILFPVRLRLMYPTDVSYYLSGGNILPSVIILCTMFIIYLLLKRKKSFSFYMSWFFIALIPVYNIVPFKAVMAERFLYLPMIAFASIFGMTSSWINVHRGIGAKVRPVLNFILIGVLISYGAMTISRNVEWRNELNLYMQEAIRSPNDATAHYDLAFAFGKEAKSRANSKEIMAYYYALAIKEYKKAISLKPTSQLAYTGLGNIYNELGFYEEAIKNFKKAIAIDEDSDVYNNLAAAYYRSGRYDEAVRCCKKALYIRPGHLNAYINLGNAYFMKKEYRKAAVAWTAALKSGGRNPVIEKRIKELPEG